MTPRRVFGAVTALATGLLLAGCAEQVVGTGEASDEIDAITSMTADTVSNGLPDEDFYGSDVAIETDPSDPYRGLCLDVELPEPDEAEAVVRFVDGTPTDDLGSSFITDETIYVFPDAGAASDFLADAVDAAGECPADEESDSGDTTYSYAYESGDVSAPGWHGHQISMSTTVDDGSDPFDNAEIRVIAQRGNAVAYLSWLVRQVDDVGSAQDQISALIDDYLVAAGGTGD